MSHDVTAVSSKFKIGQKVFRYYTAEPAFIYGSGRMKEEGEVIGPPLLWNGLVWWPVAWQYANGHPDLTSEGSIHTAEE